MATLGNSIHCGEFSSGEAEKVTMRNKLGLCSAFNPEHCEGSLGWGRSPGEKMQVQPRDQRDCSSLFSEISAQL